MGGKRETLTIQCWTLSYNPMLEQRELKLKNYLPSGQFRGSVEQDNVTLNTVIHVCRGTNCINWHFDMPHYFCLCKNSVCSLANAPAPSKPPPPPHQPPPTNCDLVSLAPVFSPSLLLDLHFCQIKPLLLLIPNSSLEQQETEEHRHRALTRPPCTGWVFLKDAWLI